MPLPLPDLDTRRWRDLVDEGRALIPRYAPGWTDHNAHDPGVTLLELLAWITEMDVYRTNQVPDRHIRKFLSLAGHPPRPPQAARVVLTLEGDSVIDAGSEFATNDGIPFQTLHTITAGVAVLAALQAEDASGAIVDRTGELGDRIPIRLDTALYFGFTQVPTGTPFSLYFWLHEQGGGVVQLAWEAFTGTWTEMAPSLDETKSLIRDGAVEVTLPPTMVQTAIGAVADPLFYLRCRVVSGSYDATPLISAIAPNSVRAEQSVPAQFSAAVKEPLLILPNAPVLRDSVEVFTGAQQWQRREDFDASQRTHFHFTLDPTLGLIRFGDGERGRTVTPGTIVDVKYRATLAELGNVDAGAIASIGATNRAPAFGGEAQEDLRTAASRAVAVLYSHDARSPHPPTRAVNLEDYERLALSVPETRVSRAKAYAAMHPDYPCLRAPGTVTVVVMPDLHVPEPMPSPELLRTVFCWLDRRRMVCTQVKVTGPHYVEVRVRARVRIADYADAARTLESIGRALDEFLNPHHWPFGRDVYRSEVLALIDRVPGVDYVISLALFADSESEQCGNLTLCATGLVASGAHQIDLTKEE